MKSRFGIFLTGICSLILGLTEEVNAVGAQVPGSENFPIIFLWIALLVLLARITMFIRKAHFPSVVGELLVGIILGNLSLIGITFFEPIKTEIIFLFLAELGLLILMFKIGLESHLENLLKRGPRAVLIAAAGTFLPFFVIYVIAGPILFPAQERITYLFLASSLTATSVGILARIYKGLGNVIVEVRRFILSIAVIDDIIALVLLAIFTSVIKQDSIGIMQISIIILKTIGFVVFSIIIGKKLAASIGSFLSSIHSGVGMKLTLIICFALFYAFAAESIGISFIIGAFSAGLVLEAVHFKEFDDPKIIDEMKSVCKPIKNKQREKVLGVLNKHSRKHIDRLVAPLDQFFVPIFFVMTGMQINLSLLLDIKVLLISFAFFFTAFVTKLVVGAIAKNQRLFVGTSMTQLGEITLIFASVGKSLGVFSELIFSVLLATIFINSLIVPVVISLKFRS